MPQADRTPLPAIAVRDVCDSIRRLVCPSHRGYAAIAVLRCVYDKPRIILAEPSRTGRLIFCETLRNTALRLECWSCTDIREARRLIAEPRDFCLFTARYFEELDGPTLCREALRAGHCVGAVLVTSDTLDHDDDMGVRLLKKPYTISQLAESLVGMFMQSPGSLRAPVASATFRRDGYNDSEADLAPAARRGR